MLTVPLETLAYIIIKAREYDAGMPEPDAESDAEPLAAAERDGLNRQELVDAINSLDDEQRIELLALTWLGRGDYGKEEWRAALAEARRIHDAKEADYLVGTPLLADYLEEALAQLGYSIEDYEIGRL
jgi:hypothetical protein